MWHDLIKNPKDLPSRSGSFLIRFEDGSMDVSEFFAPTKHFIAGRRPVAWTSGFREPDFSCSVCRKAYWQNVFGYMCYTCGMAYCPNMYSENPFA